ncbi:uncharacterized protein TNIN_438341 [Trichonephila inaurata madagascariensis]|uniref:Uncharacterized protein n=1 Tax=Trichonephila inaurata madagascariensis TaxID=2747483 RepID=A0A8X6XPS6_9ARAC|nr:uncharacterized protein TNIN_438341 [Trichonephila inaurata madagascariensis]
MLLVGAIENLKVGHQKEGVCVHPKYKRDGEKITCKVILIVLCVLKTLIFCLLKIQLLCILKTISDEGSDAGENEQYLNASARKFQMFPSTSTSTFCPSEKSTYVLMNNDMWPSLLCNIKCDECDMCSLDVQCNGAYGFSSKIELKCKSCKKIFNSVFSSP